MSDRRPWMSLYEYQRVYGELPYEVPDDRHKDRTCRWCHGELPSKRHKTFCCPEHAKAWQYVYIWNRNRPAVPWRILCRDKFTCRDCGWMSGHKNKYDVWVYTPTGLDVHHIVYVANGGNDHESNLVTLCRECHLARHGKKQHREDTNERIANVQSALFV